MTTASLFALDEAEVERHLQALLASLDEKHGGARLAINEALLAGYQPEELVQATFATWPEWPEHIQAVRTLVNAALHAEPILDLLKAQGIADLAARTLLLEVHPEWRAQLLEGWPSDGPKVQVGGLKATFSGRHYRLPRGPFRGLCLALEGGPVAKGLDVPWELTLRNLSAPQRLGRIWAHFLTLEGSTPLPRNIDISSLHLIGSRLCHCPSLGDQVAFQARASSLRTLGRRFKAGSWILDACPNLRRLPSGWKGFMVLIKECRRLASFPLPADGQVCSLTLQDLPGLRRIGAGLSARWLTLERCGIRELPTGLHTFRELTIRDCPHLRCLGRGTVVEGDLILSKLPALERLPEDLVVGGAVRWT